MYTLVIAMSICAISQSQRAVLMQYLAGNNTYGAKMAELYF